jgi:hypothetical protein
MTVVFERCLSAINVLTQTTRLVTKEFESRPLMKETLDPTIVWFRLDPSTDNLGPRRTMISTIVHTTPFLWHARARSKTRTPPSNRARPPLGK